MRNFHVAVPLFFALALVGCSADEPSLSKKGVESETPEVSVNVPPAFSAVVDQTVAEDAAPVTVSGWAKGIKAGPDGESGQKVEFTHTNDNNALFSVKPALSPEGDLTFTVAPGGWPFFTLWPASAFTSLPMFQRLRTKSKKSWLPFHCELSTTTLFCFVVLRWPLWLLVNATASD